ncbi:MAG: autotransporter outer membrane beta-barrel domain-containing protein [Treponema sp.]|jgi:hypothetical protein|nr:autotransporter outer membrane beta-barrel domain-containing protein [Treponema sp.]
MVLSHFSRRRLALFLGLPLLWCLPVPGAAQDRREPRNTIFTDLNAPLLALVYFPAGIKGFGLELGYERLLPRHFAGMASVRYLRLSLAGTLFQAWDIGLYGRYRVWAGRGVFVSSAKLGALLYDSPYYRGGSFLAGLEISWKYRPGGRFVLEPYLGCNVCADDRYLMPFTVFSLTEILIPGFSAGVRLGIGF